MFFEASHAAWCAAGHDRVELAKSMLKEAQVAERQEALGAESWTTGTITTKMGNMHTSSRTPLEERRLLPSRLLSTRDAVVRCAPARGLGWEMPSLDQFYSVLPGLGDWARTRHLLSGLAPV